MPAQKSSSAGARAHESRPATRSSPEPDVSSTRTVSNGEAGTSSRAGAGDDLATLAEQLVSRVIKPLGLVVLTRERIEEVLDDAAARGRMTRSDADDLVTELIDRGRQQTDQFLADIERLLDRDGQQLGTATNRARRGESMDRLIRSADRARRTVGVGQSFPILGYEDLTATQVQRRLEGLAPAELRKVREYERRHANRKSVLSAIDRALASG